MNRAQKIIATTFTLALMAYLAIQVKSITDIIDDGRKARQRIDADHERDMKAIKDAHEWAMSHMVEWVRSGLSWAEVQEKYNTEVQFRMMAHRTGLGEA